MNTRSAKSAIVWGGLLILFGVMAMIQYFYELGPWIWVAVLVIAGLAVLALYFTDRSEAWLLIPGYTLWAIAGLVALITLEILRDEAVAFYVLSAIALPFLVVYIRDRQQWWALIPAYVLFAIGLMVGLEGMGILNDLLIPAYVMFAIAIPFFVVYVYNRQNWWALIPGGIMAVIALAFLIAEAAIQFVVPAVLIIAGLWIIVRTFRRKEADSTEWIEDTGDESPAE